MARTLPKQKMPLTDADRRRGGVTRAKQMTKKERSAGGKARAKKLSKKRRREIAKKAIAARYAKAP